MGNQHVLTNHYSKAKFLIGSIDSCGSETLKVKYRTTLATVFLLGPISCPRDICDDLFYVLKEGNQWRGEKKRRGESSLEVSPQMERQMPSFPLGCRFNSLPVHDLYISLSKKKHMVTIC
jgi:hypothetical protein